MTKIRHRKVDKSYEIFLALYQAVSGTEEEQDIYKAFSLGGARPVALVDDHQVEEVGRERLVDVLFFFGAGDRLVEGQVDLVGLVDLAMPDLGHRPTERLEVVRHRPLTEI